MSTDNTDSKSYVRRIKASYILQAKVGAGPLDPEKVAASQRVIESNKIDFVPLGLEFLGTLEETLNRSRKSNVDPKEFHEILTQPVMQLKGNAAMFKYPLIGELANIMLIFLESLDAVDADVFQILEAHHKTLKAIVASRMQGDGGEIGATMKTELIGACRRYYTHRNLPMPSIFETTAPL